MFKRLFASLLSLAIVLSFFPTMAFAEATDRWEGTMHEDLIIEDLSETVDIESPYDYYSYSFEPDVSGTYIFKSTGEFDTYGRVMDSLTATESLAENNDGSDNPEGDANFSVEFSAKAGETYYLQAAMWGDQTGSFDVMVTLGEEDQDDPGWWNGTKYGPYIIDPGDTETVEILEPRDYYSYEFTPESDGTYIFKSSGTEDTYGRIMDFLEEEELYINDEGFPEESDHNFLIEFDAEAGETYYLQACLFEDTTGEFDISLIKKEPISIAKASVSNVVTKTYTGRAITQAPEIGRAHV